MNRLLMAGLSLLALGGCSSLPFHAAQAPAKMDFVVFGDTPYDQVDQEVLTRAVPAVKTLNPPFVLHVGDTQGGSEMCVLDARTQKLFADLKPIPVFYAVGDNEWTDCDRQNDPATGKPFSELKRLDVLRSLFFSQPAVGGGTWRYVQQKQGMPELARFDYGGLTFVTLDVVSTNNGRDSVMGDDLATAGAAANARDAGNIDWMKAAFAHARRHRSQGVVVVMQADMTSEINPASRGIPCTDAAPDKKRLCDGFMAIRQALIDEAKTYGKPVFYIHGDTAPYTLWKGVEGQDMDNLWELNAAGDAGIDDKSGQQYGVRDVTHVWIDLSRPDKLRAQGVLTGLLPSPTPGGTGVTPGQ